MYIIITDSFIPQYLCCVNHFVVFCILHSFIHCGFFLFFYRLEELKKEKSVKSKKKKKQLSAKSKAAKREQTLYNDTWLYIASILIFIFITSLFRRSWVAQTLLVTIYWVYLFWFSYRFDPVPKKK